MKIAQVVCTYPPYRGGIGRVAEEYTERLRARGHNVHVFTPRYTETKDDPDYIHRVPPILTIGNGSVLPSLYRRLSGFDLVHLHYPFFGGAEPAIVRKAIRHDQGLVMTYHMDAAAGGVRGAVFEAHRRLLFPWLIGRVDRVLVSSKDYADHSALARIKGIQDRVEVHPFGIDLKRFSPGEETELSMELGFNGKDPVIIFVGGLDAAHHFKGLPVLLRALASLSKFPWKLVVVGDGDLKESYRETAGVLGLEDRVRFVGSVSEEDLPRYYRLGDLHVLPSTKRAEAFGIVNLEAAASGIPSIVTNLAGVRSVVLDGETGLVVEPGDERGLAEAIQTLLEQVDLRERLGHSARLRAESTYAWEPLITGLVQTYRSVLGQESPRQYTE